MNKTKKTDTRQRKFIQWMNYVNTINAIDTRPVVIDTGWQRANNNNNTVTK